jgi:Uma2 family endonuclease
MATTVEPRTRHTPGEQRFLIPGIGWSGYETLRELLGGRSIRIAYDRGNVELTSPSQEHERCRRRLGRMVETLTEELNLPCVCFGSTTWRSQSLDRGIEPDDCFYLANAARVFGKTVDLEVDPPPDLAIEVDITASSLDRQGIYAALGVPEVWRFNGESLRAYRLNKDGHYTESDSSLNFPWLAMKEVVRFLLDDPGDDSTWARAFRFWVRRELAPRIPGRAEQGGQG